MTAENTEAVQQTKYFTIIFRDSRTGGKGMRLTPDGGLTRRSLFAAMIDGREDAERIASDIREDFPEATVTVKPF